jgi:hypothetical protein
VAASTAMKLTEWAVLNKRTEVYLIPWTYNEQEARTTFADRASEEPDEIRLLSREFDVSDHTYE